MINQGNVLIREALNNYSEGELTELLGESSISSYSVLIPGDLNKKHMVDAVVSLYGFKLVSIRLLRARLIERMSRETVIQALRDFLAFIKIDDNNSDRINPYRALIDLADNFEIDFIKFAGYGDSLISRNAAQKSIQGIRAINPKYGLYPYQIEMVNKVNAIIDEGKKNSCLLHLPTGAGKTRTAMNIACEHLRSNPTALVLWLADTSELCMQASIEFGKAWDSLGNRALKIYSYFSDTDISLGGIDSGFLVAGLQKIYKSRDSHEYSVLYELLKQEVSLIIFDEAHKSIAPTYEKIVLDMLSAGKKTFLLGLSATPGRSLDFNSDEDDKLSKFFGCNKITMNVPGYPSPINYLVEERYLARAQFININYDGSKILLANKVSNNKLSNKINTILSDDDARNLELLRVICEEHEKGSSIIIFACSVEHSQKLAVMLAFRGVAAYSLDSKVDNDESRRFKIEEYSSGRVRVLVNYSILTAGFDVPRTNVSIIARPTDSLVQYSQMAGRAMRGKKSMGNENCRIYTVRDDIPSFSSVAKAFSHWDSLWKEIK